MTNITIDYWNEELREWRIRLWSFGIPACTAWLNSMSDEYRLGLAQRFGLQIPETGENLISLIQLQLWRMKEKPKEPVILYLMEWDTSTSTEEPKQWGPWATEAERDSQLTIALIENVKRRILMVDFGLHSGSLKVWVPSEAYRDDLVREYNDPDDKTDRPSELTDANATRMWSADRPPMEVRALQSYLAQLKSERGEEGD